MKTHRPIVTVVSSLFFAPLLKIYRRLAGAGQRIRQALSPCRPRFLFATLNVNETLCLSLFCFIFVDVPLFIARESSWSVIFVVFVVPVVGAVLRERGDVSRVYVSEKSIGQWKDHPRNPRNVSTHIVTLIFPSIRGPLLVPWWGTIRIAEATGIFQHADISVSLGATLYLVRVSLGFKTWGLRVGKQSSESTQDWSLKLVFISKLQLITSRLELITSF